ncbi:hypothetical protein Q1695_007378 [Nippostrongylus brasiliensis]|nr:hypothetical protein Q1695_007378 [Nippostrongylus brasiliensis]
MGRENIFIFGVKVDEVEQLQKRGYSVGAYIRKSAAQKQIPVQGDQVRNAQIFATGTVLVKYDLGTPQKLKESLERILNDDRFGRLPNLDPYRRQHSFVEYFLLDVFLTIIAIMVVVAVVTIVIFRKCMSLFKVKMKRD